jgi:pimeloyl-ACP methyl ester carboxylesterase
MSSPALHSLVLSKGKPGTPILLLHGWGHTVGIIRSLGERLADIAEVHMLDLPGHGRSEEPDGVWGMADFALRVAEYLDEQKIPQVDIVGHSFGGKTSIKLANLRPDLIRRIVLLNSSGLRPQRTLKKHVFIRAIALLRWCVKKIDRFVDLKLFERWFIPRFASPDYLSAGAIRKTFVRTVNEELTEELKGIRMPTLLVWGELDTETPLELGKRMHALIPASEMIVLDGKGHEPFLGAGAHLCFYHMKPFLSEGRKSAECGEELSSSQVAGEGEHA